MGPGKQIWREFIKAVEEVMGLDKLIAGGGGG